MADPLSILMMVNASLGIARSLVHTIKELYEIAEAYETAALGIRTVATQCNSFRIAIERIHKWLLTQSENNRNDIDEDFWQALKSNLDTGAMVIEDLDRRIEGLKKSPAKFWTRTKYLWNGVVISELQGQIQGLMSAVSLLIHVIDLPNKGQKRTLSRAQSTRLNGLTKSARDRVRDQQRRAREAHEQDGLDDAASPSASGTDLRHVLKHESGNEGAPPPYASVGDTVSVTDSKRTTEKFPTAVVNAEQSSFNVLAKSKSNELPMDKKKRPSWKNFMKRSSKDQYRTLSGSSDIPAKTVSPSSATKIDVPEVPNQIQATPGAVESPQGQENYFDLQSAMSGMSMTESTVHEMSSSPLTQRSPTTYEVSRQLSAEAVPAIDKPDPAKPKNRNPYLAMRLAAGSKPRTDYRAMYEQANQSTDNEDNFNRIRPSQRLQHSREVTSRQETTLREPASRLGSLNFSADVQDQSWQTAAITNQSTKFKVSFPGDAFENRMSASAARALGVDEHIQIIDCTPLATLTLLHVVSDVASNEATAVNSDVVEFEVMNEHQSRVPELRIGQGFVHLAGMMNEGQYIYWNPQPVPKTLRTVDRLRLYRRFELIRW